MDFEFSEDQELLRESVRRFLEDEAPISSYVRDLYEDDCGYRDPVWRGLAELGLMGILVPEQYGGSGSSMLEAGVVLEEMGRLVHPGPYLSSAIAAASLIESAGSELDCCDLLPGIAQGSVIATVALHEEGSRWDWRSPTTRATESAEGWNLTGIKTSVPDAMSAHLYLVVALVEGERDPAVFAVEATARGVKRHSTTTIDGTRKQGRLEFDGVNARRLAGVAPLAAIEEMMDRVLIALVVDGVGAAARAMEMSVAYAMERKQFGVPVGSFQSMQHMLAEMLQQLELGRAGAYYALWAACGADAEERHRAAIMAKAFASDAFQRIGADAIQTFAGVGFTWEYDVHFYYKRLLSLQSAFGGSSDHLEELARIVLGDIPSDSAPLD
jgi:alkylation response protein AidB-like acyl-CoA dehydrogenase